ncbi:MAG TPA: DUF6175 family protein [Gemmatimonadaceae bacterium]|nr:DUF6175 family protein [Gemmatimonadaceae bacterium]
MPFCDSRTMLIGMSALVLLVTTAVDCAAQAAAPAPHSSTVPQPRIMVIPRVNEGQDIRRVLDSDLLLRVALAKVKEAYDARGFTTVDFVGRLKAANDNGLFTSQSQSDIKEQIIQLSGADIYIEVEPSTTSVEGGPSAIVVLGAYEASTGNSLASTVGNSGVFRGATDPQLIQRAVTSAMDGFLDAMQSKFLVMLDEGHAILVDVGLQQGIHTTFDSPFMGKEGSLAELLESWISNNSLRNNYHLQGTTQNRMVFDDVRIPLRDPRTGRSYGASQFGNQLAAYMRTLGLTVSRDIKSSTLVITVTRP